MIAYKEVHRFLRWLLCLFSQLVTSAVLALHILALWDFQFNIFYDTKNLKCIPLCVSFSVYLDSLIVVIIKLGHRTLKKI